MKIFDSTSSLAKAKLTVNQVVLIHGNSDTDQSVFYLILPPPGSGDDLALANGNIAHRLGHFTDRKKDEVIEGNWVFENGLELPTLDNYWTKEELPNPTQSNMSTEITADWVFPDGNLLVSDGAGGFNEVYHPGNPPPVEDIDLTGYTKDSIEETITASWNFNAGLNTTNLNASDTIRASNNVFVGQYPVWHDGNRAHLDDISDVAAGTASEGQVLTYNTNLKRWENRAPVGGVNEQTSKAQNGYVKLTSGIIFQWGLFTSTGDNPETFNFPTAFPTACGYCDAHLKTSGNYQQKINVISWTRTNFVADRDDAVSANAPATFFAVGY